MPVEAKDLERLLIELHPAWASQDTQAIEDWLKREGISQGLWEQIGDDMMAVTQEGVRQAIENDDASELQGSVIAGFQLAFFVGWEMAKQYAPRRDMSREEE